MPKRPNTRRIANLVPSNTERDWKFSTALESGALTASGPLPNSVDLRDDWWNIGNQRNTGSCVGWATADALLRYHFVKTERLATDELLSTRFTWMAAKETDEFNQRPTTFIDNSGTSLKAALDVTRKFGAVKDSVLPFNSGKLYQGKADTFYAIAAKLKIVSYFNLFKQTNHWKSWLTNNGPLLVGLNVDETWDNATQNDGKLDSYQEGTGRGGHAVAVVGYLENGSFIIRNSWGTKWGDDGFAYATEDYIQGAFYEEAYGIKV